MLIQGQVGAPAQSMSSGSNPTFRQGQLGEQIMSELHGSYYEQCYRGNMFSIGHTAVLPLAATHATATSKAAIAVPILGVWNPATSTVNLCILKATLTSFINNVTSVAPGALVWLVSNGNGAISTGLTPFSRKTLAQAGSQAKAFAGATPLTGLTNALVELEGAGFPIASGLLTTSVAAATPTPAVSGTDTFDGDILVPPGGVFALMNTLAVTTHSVFGKLIWEEVPV